MSGHKKKTSETNTMTPKEKVELIRQGNQAFNEKHMRKARECFLKAEYKDGLGRMGDFYFYEKRLPMLAYGYYKKAGMDHKVQEIFYRMVAALSQWIGKDKVKPKALETLIPNRPQTSGILSQEPMVEIKFHPLLKETAMKILANQKK
jgi:hypothetical protein